MIALPPTRLASIVALGGVAIAAGCLDDELALDDDSTALACTGSDIYTPYAAGWVPSGTVAQYPWRGATSSYPDGHEDFRGYSPLPITVECASDKARRSYVDVTSGCLTAVALGGGLYTRGQITTTNEYFRALALGHDQGRGPVKWTDQSIEYRFFYGAQTGTVGNPGFKAFARYRSEYDLYVASWRTDGVVQIQKKQCGVYTPLAVLPSFGAPSADTWHWIRFDAIGDRLDLYLDHVLVLSTTSNTFSWGTAGIRIDSMNGAYLDDWRVSAP